LVAGFNAQPLTYFWGTLANRRQAAIHIVAEHKYTTQLNALLNPPSELWAMSMPRAWTCIKDVLATAKVESGTSGVSNWRITQEDNTIGVMQAQINFKQALGTASQQTIVSRNVTMHAQLTPEGEGTRVDLHYEIMSPSGTGLVESVIKKTQELMTQRVKIGKGE
jgi:hypothetical protein